MENIDLSGFAEVWQRVTEAEDAPLPASTETPPAAPVFVTTHDTPHAVRFIPET